MDPNIEDNEETAQTVDDLVIAEAVEVLITMYSCRFCSKRFDTIDKVKTHFLKRHSTALEVSNTGQENEEPENMNETNELVEDETVVPETGNEDDEEGMEEDIPIKDETNEEKIKKPINKIVKKELKTDKTTIVIQKTTKSNDTNVGNKELMTTRSRTKKGLPNNMELKIIRPDSDPDIPPKRGRPKKYELRACSAGKLKNPPRRYPCPFDGCEYVAKYRSNLWDHKKIHTGEKPYACQWPSCDMRFPQSQQLRLHLRSHTGEKPYACQWPGCEMAFSQKPGLKAHMRTHTGEKPFECDWPGCEWKFRLKGALTDHKRAVHENEKSFVCEWPGCNKKFLQSCHLRKHMMAHADIKPFTCDWPNCNYKAVSMSYVTNHKKTHTGEKNFECNYNDCNKRFVKASHVNRHQQRCHPEMFDQTISVEGQDVEVYSINSIEI